ncbi:S-adenosyl-l-methionine hydroxide adenosyltransferase family protein [Scrofimicrobium sp. R131]|uniref:SAM hydrolase/SAM-dependent halogenase family protein n=1 Tax=Scrofimicrobium appendicitidis TaxID=3079930 RepID=UPI0033055FDC
MSETADVVGIVVFQSDFGLRDGAVAAMKGVASGVDLNLRLYDLTHQIPPYTIWDGAYRLYQTLEYWPAGTVFVSVVDPGVGSARKSVVARTKTGHFVVTPDNGTLTLIADVYGIAEMREINEAVNRRTDSHNPYTFHGRDVYAYTGARLAAGIITFEQVGDLVTEPPLALDYQRASIQAGQLHGNVPALDIRFGNVWTNISHQLAEEFGLTLGQQYRVEVFSGEERVFAGDLPYVNVFADVEDQGPLIYFNSLDQLSLATNLGNFARENGISHGNEWSVTVSKLG